MSMSSGRALKFPLRSRDGKPTAFRGQWRPGFYFSEPTNRIIGGQRFNPLQKSLVAKFNSRKKDHLWIEITGNTLDVKPVIRSWTKRRIREALFDSLKLNGYDRKGKALGGMEATGKMVAPLWGTMTVLAMPSAVTESYCEIQSQMSAMVREIMSRTQTAKHSSLPRTPSSVSRPRTRTNL
ncbi:hypothetical protein MMC09_001939 [Bachmanniomyces sp. S44760]|nr:hypothetical protein [Bachmanniomyces sp. S44760]